jgi:hypothetical protein
MGLSKVAVNVLHTQLRSAVKWFSMPSKKENKIRHQVKNIHRKTDYTKVQGNYGARVVAQLLRHHATSRNVASSITDLVFFSFNLPSPLTMALGFTQPLTEINIRKPFWRVKGGRRLRLTNLPPSVNWLSRTVLYNFTFAFPKCNFSSCVNLQSCLCIIQVTHSLYFTYKTN